MRHSEEIAPQNFGTFPVCDPRQCELDQRGAVTDRFLRHFSSSNESSTSHISAVTGWPRDSELKRNFLLYIECPSVTADQTDIQAKYYVTWYFIEVFNSVTIDNRSKNVLACLMLTSGLGLCFEENLNKLGVVTDREWYREGVNSRE